MNTIIDSRFERVEKALATLITSISTFNPAPALANDLVAADAELSQGLEQLSVHQSNHSKILALRNTSSNLDAQIRETLSLLNSTRSQLLATPSTTFPEDSNPVSYSELLSYARRISKFTLPPTFREPEPPASNEVIEGATTGSAATPHTNGSSTPVAVINGVERDLTAGGSAMETDSAMTPAAGTSQPQASQSIAASNSLPANFSVYLNPISEQVFFPWPSEEYLRRGALASIQILTDKGIDPATFDPEKSAELEAERKRIMEEEDRAREEQRQRMELEKRREIERRMSVGASVPGERIQEKPKQFELETFDDDDDD